MSLRAPETHGANQAPPLKPTQPKNAEQTTRDRRGLRNRAIYLDIIELELEIVAIGLPPVNNSRRARLVYVHSRSGRERDSKNGSGQCNDAGEVPSKSSTAIGAHLKLNRRIAVSSVDHAKLTDVTLYKPVNCEGGKGISTPKGLSHFCRNRGYSGSLRDRQEQYFQGAPAQLKFWCRDTGFQVFHCQE